MKQVDAIRSIQTDARLQLLPPESRARLWLLVLALVLPVAITAITLVVAVVDRSISSPIAGSVPLSAGAVLALVLVVTVPLWMLLDCAIRRHRLIVHDGMLDIHTSF